MTITGHIYSICYDNEIIYTGKTVNMKQRWKTYRNKHNNPRHRDYNMNIHAFMREKGFDTCEMMLLETIEVEELSDLAHYEGMWQETFEELGCALQNKQKAGNGNGCVKGTIAYDNSKKRDKEKIPCPLCGFVGRRGDIRRHQRSANCVPRD